MDNECVDKRAGVLLHAYELGLLSDEEKDQFEAHLMECPYCFNEVKQFMPRGAFLRSSPRIKQELAKGLKESVQGGGYGERLKRYFWPKAPYIYRPAILYALILILLLPAIGGLRYLLRTEEESAVRPVQTIFLTTTRSLQRSVFKIAEGVDGAIFFSCPGIKEGSEYQLEIALEDGREIFSDDHFRDFDERKSGQLLYPRELMTPGNYLLVIRGLVQDSLRVICDYAFSIE